MACVCVCVVCACSVVSDSFATLCQAPLSLEFSGQEYWSRLPSLLQDIFLTHVSCIPPLAREFFFFFFTTAAWEAPLNGLPNLLDISKGYLIDDLYSRIICADSSQESGKPLLKGQVAIILGSVSQRSLLKLFSSAVRT